MVRILRSNVMVRVGGGWVSLNEFLLKNDPCRCKFLLNFFNHIILNEPYTEEFINYYWCLLKNKLRTINRDQKVYQKFMIRKTQARWCTT